jgi:hypothetical protein
MKARLQLNLDLEEGREVECAKYLRGQLVGKHWAILAALAAELVHEHENLTGSTVVVVAGPSQAERVLRDLDRAR